VPDDALEREMLMQELRALVSTLDERGQRVMGSLYAFDGNPHTMAETAEAMGLKRERVRQIRDKAIRQISKLTKNTSLKDYLNA